ncbi:pilus assembly protein TadG-related protein [Chelatococcus sp. GCM10030263]|uniref:TadE/TadG family type IV pilus assembly protein n=1 Tax=Chelatococcus sp. GCM10030263 TaxID=3273387 RepID=UPI00360E498D
MIEQPSAGPRPSRRGAAFRRVRTFGRARDGNVALWFALMLLPLLLAVGAAIDYARAATLRAKLQQATDAAILAVAPLAGQKTDAELKALAESYLRSAMKEALDTMGGRDAHVESIVVTSDRGDVTITSSAVYDPVFMNIGALRQQTITLGTLSRSLASDVNYEIALVIDNSGSMGNKAGSGWRAPTKMAATKTAALSLIDAMFSTTSGASRTRISLVPFNLSVEVGTEYARYPWTDTEGKSSIHWDGITFEKPVNPPAKQPGWPPKSRFDLFDELKRGNASYGWGGCFEMRPGDWGVNDLPPTTADYDSFFVPQFAPDEPDANNGDDYIFGSGRRKTTWRYPNSYLDDNSNSACSDEETGAGDYVKAQTKLCKYKYKQKFTTPQLDDGGPNYMCNVQPLTRLTSDKDAIETKINQMVADGTTNLVEGFMWGWRTISPNAPFTDGQPYQTRNNRKVIIFMTDGMNVWSTAKQVNEDARDNHDKSQYSPFGYYISNRLTANDERISNATEAAEAMDAKTLEACTNAKAAGILVYTVGFDTGSDITEQGRQLLKDCASPDPSGTQKLAYIATNSGDIIKVFNDIAHQLGALRLAQ